ncbi:MAG: DEAD/DEAH box helicase [Phycisphaerales bacterium]|nr:MAG: DEAD/DEAH box helicase [Phycisphaerales bacterium]
MQKHQELPQAFADLGIEVRFLKALRKMRFDTPSEIQAAMIPVGLAGRDILGQARTGTGKTAAFGLPILQHIDPAARLQAICLAPTRELAVQVTSELNRLAEFANIRIVAVYGGQKVATQLHQLGRKPHFVVGTPGRVIDFINRRKLDIQNVRFVVLDEVDRMLDIGFRDDIKNILGRVTAEHQTILVSATIDEEIRRLAQRYLHDPAEINVSRDKLTLENVSQSYVTVAKGDKFRLLRLFLRQKDPPISLVFCNTKHGARKLAKKLHSVGVNAKEIHGDLIQRKRDRVMDQFRKHKIKVLVATDLAARGIDVSEISHIINYDLPMDLEVYIHRIGRTGRMGAKGIALAFVTPEEGKQLTGIEMLINEQIPECNIDGFVPTPQETPTEPTAPTPLSRLRAPVHSEGEDGPAKPPPKTLGSRFRPTRRRRL